MIPKVIHYCWFGRNPLPDSAQRCIASWKSFFPDYEVRRWDETNFEINSIPYISEAYNASKYAFVSDYARFVILYHYGGLYFDTDVEIIRPFRSILERGSFMGREAGTNGKVAPGLGLGFEPGNSLLYEIIQKYKTLHFLNNDGSLNQKTVVDYTTELLIDRGLIMDDTIQEIDSVTFYPTEYFCPMDSTTGIIRVTPNTVSIHHYDCSWLNHKTIKWKLHLLKNYVNRLLFKYNLKYR